MLAAQRGNHPPARRALQEAELEQIRLVDVFDRVRLLAERDRERREADGPALELVRDRVEQIAVDALEADVVHFEQLEGLGRDVQRDLTAVTNLGDVSDAPEDPICHSRRAARPARDLYGSLVREVDAEDSGRAPHDRRELVLLVVAETERHAEAVAQRRREETGPGRRADEREVRQIERERPSAGALSDHDVEPEVLERRIQDLLDGPVHPMDLVDEEDVAWLEAGEDRRHVALPLERGARDRSQADAELLADDGREGRLPESGRPDE